MELLRNELSFPSSECQLYRLRTELCKTADSRKPDVTLSGHFITRAICTNATRSRSKTSLQIEHRDSVRFRRKHAYYTALWKVLTTALESVSFNDSCTRITCNRWKMSRNRAGNASAAYSRATRGLPRCVVIISSIREVEVFKTADISDDSQRARCAGGHSPTDKWQFNTVGRLGRYSSDPLTVDANARPALYFLLSHRPARCDTTLLDIHRVRPRRALFRPRDVPLRRVHVAENGRGR